MSDTDHVGRGRYRATTPRFPRGFAAPSTSRTGTPLRWRVVDEELRVTVVSTEAGAFDDVDQGRSTEEVEGLE